MLDQMFTAENFRKIFDRENRKGLDLATRYFPDLEQHTTAVREAVKSIRELRRQRGTLSKEEFEQKLAQLKTMLADRKSTKSTAISTLMDGLSQNVTMTDFKIALSQKIRSDGKAVYCIDNTAETFFVIKQLQHNINRIYKVKQSNRHDIVCRIRDTVRSKFPFEVVRTDISSFYESIDRKKLWERIDEDQLLGSSSKKYLKQILAAYESLSGATTGIPRGVGVSAYLAELYFRSIDKAINKVSGIVLYARYVDDIIAIFARPPVGSNLGSYLDTIIDIFSKNGLTHNAGKTAEFKTGPNVKEEFEYLGYKFELDNGKLDISPSINKIKKYEMRLDAAFERYHKYSSVDSRRSAREIVARIKFLTGNARLLNSKSGAVTGIYYNNSLVTNKSSFTALDKILKEHIETIRRNNVKKRLKEYKFVDGFETRRFHNFSTSELHRIVEVWKHG